LNIVVLVIVCFLTIVFLSFVAGTVETWWERRKWDKERKRRE